MLPERPDNLRHDLWIIVLIAILTIALACACIGTFLVLDRQDQILCTQHKILNGQIQILKDHGDMMEEMTKNGKSN